LRGVPLQAPSPASSYSAPSPHEVPLPPLKKTEKHSNVGSGHLIRNTVLLMKAERDSNISSATAQQPRRSNSVVLPTCFNSGSLRFPHTSPPASSHRDIVDEFLVPASQKALFYQSPVDNLPYRNGPDPQLMQRFLNSSAEMSIRQPNTAPRCLADTRQRTSRLYRGEIAHKVMSNSDLI